MSAAFVTLQSMRSMCGPQNPIPAIGRVHYAEVTMI